MARKRVRSVVLSWLLISSNNSCADGGAPAERLAGAHCLHQLRRLQSLQLRRLRRRVLGSRKEEVGIEGWNEMEDRYAFLYCKEGQSVKKRVLVKVLAFGDSLLAVDTVDLDEDKEPFHLKIKVEDFVSGETQSKNYTEMYKNFKGLIENVNSAILEKVEGKTVISRDKEEKSKEPASSSSSNIYEGSDRVPASSDYGVIYPPIPTHSGDSDIHPGPGAGFYPTRGDRGDGSMLIGPNNPMFFRPGQPRVPGVPQIHSKRLLLNRPSVDRTHLAEFYQNEGTIRSTECSKNKLWMPSSIRLRVCQSSIRLNN